MKKVKSRAASVLLASAMALSLTSCGKDDDKKDDTTAKSEEVTTEATSGDDTTTEATTEEPQKVLASVDFEDEKFDFVTMSTESGRDKSELSIADFAGSKALKVTNTEGGNMFIAINVSALLGDDVEKLSSIVLDIGTENTDGSGKFYASSGLIYSYTGESNSEVKGNAWSVYLDTANPKTATFDVSGAGFVAGKDNYIIISKETDNAPVAQNMYIDNIAFLDASGATLTADSSAVFGNPAGFGAGIDRSNLFGIQKPVEFAGFQIKGAGWAQDGLEMPQEIIDALVPGSVVEIAYKSETGHMWLVMPDAEAGWMRVGVGDYDGSGQQYAYTNNAGNTVQITYEQLAAVLGEDVSKWGARMQCESDGAWEVTSVKVGQAAPHYAIAQGAVDFAGFQVSGAGWAQNGVAFTPEVTAALVPGSVVEISYKSETGKIWIVMNEAEAGWMRVGVGDADGSGQGYAVQDGAKCYITYEQIAEYCGDDVSKWGSMMQCESDGAWEVTGVRVGPAAEVKPVNSKVDLGAAVSGAGWAQNGVELTEEQIAALVPGSVISISYKSESGEIWIVMPGAEAGWMRVGVGDYDGSGQGYALFDGSSCQIPYEMIAQYCGDDVSKWGNVIQFEASTAWEVTSAAIMNVK